MSAGSRFKAVFRRIIRGLGSAAGLLLLGCQAMPPVLPAGEDGIATVDSRTVGGVPTEARPPAETPSPAVAYPHRAPGQATKAPPGASPSAQILRGTPAPSRTPTASATYSPFVGAVLGRFDLTADGQVEVVSRIGGELVVFAAALGPGEQAIELARVAEGSQLTDLNEDGTYEILTPDGVNRWQVRRWDGATFAVAEPIVEPEAATPAPVSSDALPSLPADLFFEQGGRIRRWPREGGRASVLWPRSGRSGSPTPEGAWPWQAEAGIYEGVGLRRRWKTSADGRWLAVIERRSPPAIDGDPVAWTTLPQRFRVMDLAGGADSVVPVQGFVQDSWSNEGWALSADGRWLVYLARGLREGQLAPTPEVPESHGPPRPADLIAVDLANGARETRLATCDVYTPPPPRDVEHGTSGCYGLSLAPDGRRVAYCDGRGLWLVAMPGGEGQASAPRLVAEHTYGSGIASVRIICPAAWSPDRSKLLAEQFYYEGMDSAIVDLGTGGVQTIENSTRYANLGSEIAWLPGGGAVAHARWGGWGDGRGGEGLTRVEAGDVSLIKPLLAELRVTDTWQVVGPKVMADGMLRFGLRHGLPRLYHSDGVFEVGPDGRGWRRLAPLPPGAPPGDDVYYPESLLWSPDGSAFLSLAGDPSWEPVAGPAWIGRIEGDEARVWDAGPVLRGARWIRWGGGDYFP